MQHSRLSVVLGILCRQQQILVALRPAHVSLAGFWEFPGGKIENAESAFDALKREMDEEIGIQVKEAKLLFDLEHSYHNKHFLFSTWQIMAYDGEIHGREGQRVKWVDMECVPTLKMPPSNQEMWPKIKTAVMSSRDLTEFRG